MQNVCIERSHSWGYKNFLLPLVLSWDYSVPHPCTLCITPASKTEQEYHIHQVNPPPLDINHGAWKDLRRDVHFSQETSLARGIQATLVGGERRDPEQRDQSQKRLWKGRAWGSRWFLPVGYFVDKDYKATQSARHEPANGKAFPVGPVKYHLVIQ